MEITAKMVKDLRESTGAGMMDCKKALVAADGDMELAVDNLRKSGIAKAAKKAGRTAKEGRVVVCIDGATAAMAEVLCETDFVARNETFSGYAESLVERIVKDGHGNGDLSAAVADAERDAVTELVAKIGENMQVRRVVRWETAGAISSYLHMGGRIGVMVDVEGDASAELLSDICMHIAAFSPRFVTPDDIPADLVQKEQEIAAAQVEGKPEAIIEKIVMGKISKWHAEVCLMNQEWLRDDKSCLAKVAPGITVKRFERWAVGEDI